MSERKKCRKKREPIARKESSEREREREKETCGNFEFFIKK